MRPVCAVLNRQALADNLSRARQLARGANVMAVLKANAYGHGLLPCAEAFAAADAFGVLDLQDAIALREAGMDQRICLLEGLFRGDDPTVLAEYGLEPVVHSDWQIDQLEACQFEAAVDVWLKIDTGMHRLGLLPEQVDEACARLSSIPGIRIAVAMSHLSNADDPDDDKTDQQLRCLQQYLPKDAIEQSLANSAAVCAWPQTHLDWVRPGIMLYGSSPLLDKNASQLGLLPVMELVSEVISVRTLGAGDAVGYGSTWICPESMRVGVIACGYGDGYPRHAPAGTPVLVDGRTTHLIGRVSMDMITVDLRGHDTAQVGSRAEMWGKNLSIDTVARFAGTISYELMCGITARVRRVEA